MQYFLSNAQRKELLIRAKPLAIAIPTPLDDPADWLAWARDLFCEDGQYIHRAPETMSLPYAPCGNADAGLGAVIGTSVNPATTEFYWLVEVAIVEFDPPVKPRSTRGKVQWPAFVRDNFGRWPREVSDAKK